MVWSLLLFVYSIPLVVSIFYILTTDSEARIIASLLPMEIEISKL